MTHTPTAYQENAVDFYLEAPRGNILDVSSEFSPKWGVATNLDNGVLTDIWVRANPTDNQPIYRVAAGAGPGRIHQIVSTSTNDDGSPAGTGCRTLRVFGLTSWTATDFTEEVVTMNGTSNVATSNAYVHLNRMTAETYGSAGPNVGTITATSDASFRVTAQIAAGVGQTQQAVFGWPSTKTIYITNYDVSITRTASSTVTFSITINPSPNTLGDLDTIVKHNISLHTDATSSKRHFFRPYYKHVGPGLMTIRGLADANNIEATASFSFFLVDN